MPTADPETRLKQILGELRESAATNQLRDKYFSEPGWSQDGGPYPWQKQFHDLGMLHRERALICANQIGKSFTCAAEVAMHLTGLYPPWWEGYRFSRPIEVLVSGQTNETVREINQKKLIGDIDQSRQPDGTGWIPKERIGKPDFKQAGIRNVVESVLIQHETGGWSRLKFLAYEAGGSKFQGVQNDLWWPDEEPDHEADRDMIWSEARRGLINRGGIMLFSRTPLYGLTKFVSHFVEEGYGAYVTATMDDAPHMGEAEREEYLASLPPHERETREKGVPMLGEGAVFPIGDAEIMCSPFEVPGHYRRIAGIDFGIDHPGAGAWLAHDTDTDVVYVYDCYKTDDQTPAYHAARLRGRGAWIPVAWPHDGENRDKGSGHRLKDLFEQAGAKMLPLSARYDDEKGSGQPVEPVVMDLYERMTTGRLKVFSHLNEWMKEKRMYHRKDGKIVAKNDDILKATMYGLMMLRYAVSKRQHEAKQQQMAMPSSEYRPLDRFFGKRR